MSMKSTSHDKENDDEDWQRVELEQDLCSIWSRYHQQQAEKHYSVRTNFQVNQLTMVDNNIEAIGDVPSDETTPSRDELLSIVRKHSRNLGQSDLVEKDVGDDEVDMWFWREMFDMFFIRGVGTSKSRQDDDMIFFVRYASLHHEYVINDIEAGQPYFVRRWSPKLDKVIGENELEVDWRRSFYLNLIAHTSFKVTVAICSMQTLENYQRAPGSTLTPIYKVTKTVYASPSRVNFQLDSKKASETFPAYPDICFAVDDFDNTFDAVVLTERDHCYCVFLNADGGAAFPPEKLTQDCSSSETSNFGQIDQLPHSYKMLTLFSGFVNYKMVREAYESGHSKLGGFLFVGSSDTKCERLFMRGPGGCGEVEVAVSAVIDQSEQETGPLSPVQISKGSFKMGIGTIFRVAKHVAAAAARKPESEMLPLRCCLMSLSLPWETLAHDLLFKRSPKREN